MHSGQELVGKPIIPAISLGYSYRLKDGISVGTSMGFEFYEWLEIPWSVFVRMRMTDGVVSPVLIAKTGYTLPAEKREKAWDYSYTGKGGAHVTLGIGVEKILNENASFLFSFTWHYQELNYHLKPQHQWVQERDRTETYNRLQISIGYIFKYFRMFLHSSGKIQKIMP